jgi:ribonuclease E
MVLESNRELVLRRLVECLARDRTKHQVAEVTSLGLVQMTRKRVGEGLLEAFSETCETCHGRGVIIHAEPVDKQPAAEDDRPAGKGKRKRGKSAAVAQPEPPVDPATEEQRRAASAAIAAIHRAAAGDKPEGGELELVDELASDLVEAVAASDSAEPATEAVAARESAEPAPAVDGAEAAPPPAELRATPAPDEPEAAPPRRRRRVASRPAGPPGAA